ncbi:MAG: DUF2334 domain-containing protein [Ignavibacteriales bacterium]|nr:DUF2334 domain-containing protein [Ignavibacteriales bacterium]
MKIISKIYFLILLISFLSLQIFGENNYKQKGVLVVVQGTSELTNLAMGDGRQLAQLLGHFNTITDVIGVDEYKSSSINNYDYIFYIGFYLNNSVPITFLNDIVKTNKPTTWINTGFIEFSNKINTLDLFGFKVTKLDTASMFDLVKSNNKSFTKGEGNINMIEISDYNKVEIIATAISSKKKHEVPYIVKSNNLVYIADSPFAYANSTDRYLLFADYLHEILNEQHEESHTAIVRIEDVTPLDDPDKIRDITDYLSERGIPFLIGVVPFYVDPIEGIRISLSEKPDMADALRYAEINGGTIVMHGITHQYKDVTASDFEFWDANLNLPIQDEKANLISRKIEMGLSEYSKNGLHPLLWETPHYTASNIFYETISNYFSSAIEQRLSIENPDYCQFFPYIIYKDLYGQKIYPENLGYIPLNLDPKEVKKSVVEILSGAKANLNVRDGFASFFFHSFLDIDILKELIDEIEKMGYTFLNLKDEINSVKSKKQILLSGTQNYSLIVDDQYVTETYFDQDGKIKEKKIADKRTIGTISKKINLKPGEYYNAELTEFLKSEPGFLENLFQNVSNKYDEIFDINENWNEPRVVILWNHFAKGAAYNDQASLASVFQSVNLIVDTIFSNQHIDLGNYNLLIVPYTAVESLKPTDYNIITNFVKSGGNVITDTKNYLSEELGIKYTSTQIKVVGIRDNNFHEEKIVWSDQELVNKFETNDVEEVFCFDQATEFPMVIGKKYGDGKVIYISSKFDPHSQLGYSHYPYLLEYVRQYFHLKPTIKKNNLEVYFDPGFRSKISIEKLVKQWVKQGIRIIHAAGWHQYPKYTYDYKTLIKLAHANGILVYAWLEPPQVSQKFWADHPEWREKNYLGEDVRPSWRYPVALTDAQCVNNMKNEFVKFLENYDWDGVNLAELYFEAGLGFESPTLFTPMHSSAQKEVKEKYGIDLPKIFDTTSKYYWENNSQVRKSVIDYRVKKLNQVYEILLNSFQEIANRKKGFQIIVTAMDSYGSPELREYIADDMDNILKLQKKYNFILQVEDPQHLWSTNPNRYFDIGKLYLEKISDKSKLMLDLNILKFRNENDIIQFPTLTQTGTESFHMVRSASLGAPRLTIYSESSVNPQDLYYMPYALASEVKYKVVKDGIEYYSPTSFTLELPKRVTSISLNNNTISPGRNNSFIIPAGINLVKFNTSDDQFNPTELQTKILSFSGNLLSIKYGYQDLLFTYESDTRTIISLNRVPTEVTVDGKNYKFKIMEGEDCFSIFLPVGTHNVDLTVGDAFSKGVNLTSFWSSTSIALFGTFSIVLLLIMYLSVKYLNHKYRLQEIKQ